MNKVPNEGIKQHLGHVHTLLDVPPYSVCLHKRKIHAAGPDENPLRKVHIFRADNPNEILIRSDSQLEGGRERKLGGGKFMKWWSSLLGGLFI